MKEKIEPSPIPQDEHRVVFFAALCLFLSAVEYAIPKPLPFLRLGLANLPVLLSLPKLSKKNIALLVFMKTLGQGLISGTLFSYVFVFSSAGSFASALGMGIFYYLFVYKKDNPFIGFVGLSLVGALCNNMAQLVVAQYMIFGAGTLYIAPLLLCTGTVTGLLLGLFAEKFAKTSRWYASLEGIR